MNEYDISLRIILKGESGTEVKSLVRIFDYMEGALYQSDRKDVEEIAQKLNLPEVIRDAALERLRSYRGRRLRIQTAKPGSIVLFGIVTGVSIFVLKNTVGESVKEGWKDSSRHIQLSNAFRDLFDSKLSNLIDQLKTFISKYRNSNVKLIELKSEQGSLIEIEIEESKKDAPPTIGEALESQSLHGD